MTKHDLIVIGGGPGGYVAAIRAAQLGLNVACIEKEAQLGGTCLRVGCIPSKALLESSERYHSTKTASAEHGITVGDVTFDVTTMMDRKTKIVDMLTKGIDALFKKNGVTRYLGAATFIAPGKVKVVGDETIELEADKIIIATGSTVATIPGVELDGDRIGSSTEALSYSETPEHLVVIGAGVIGLELGSVWNRVGSKITVLEYLDTILPGMDAEIVKEAHKQFKKQKFAFKLGCRVTGARVEGDKCVVEISDGEPIECDRVLVAVGRKPNTEGLGLENVGIELDKAGRIPIDDHFATSVPNIYAIGDVVRGPMLAHKAEEEGVACAEQIVTGKSHVNYDAIPGIVYTHPEIATVGKTEEQLKEANVPYRSGVFQFRANGRAKAVSQIDGKAKILAHAETDKILGAHIIGPQAGELIAEVIVAMEAGMTADQLGRVCHGHPTLSEAVKEAALDVADRAIHA